MYVYIFQFLYSQIFLQFDTAIELLSSAKAIDEYASIKSKAAESNDEAASVDPRLEAIVERMLDKYVKL